MDNWEYTMGKKRKKVETNEASSDDFRMNGELKDNNIYSSDNHIYFYSIVLFYYTRLLQL